MGIGKSIGPMSSWFSRQVLASSAPSRYALHTGAGKVQLALW